MSFVHSISKLTCMSVCVLASGFSFASSTHETVTHLCEDSPNTNHSLKWNEPAQNFEDPAYVYEPGTPPQKLGFHCFGAVSKVHPGVGGPLNARYLGVDYIIQLSSKGAGDNEEPLLLYRVNDGSNSPFLEAEISNFFKISKYSLGGNPRKFSSLLHFQFISEGEKVYMSIWANRHGSGNCEVTVGGVTAVSDCDVGN